MYTSVLVLFAVIDLALFNVVVPAAALDEMQDQETIAELLATPPPPAEQGTFAERRWGILPEFGYGPETGAKGGIKFQHRDVAGFGVDLDLHGSYAMNQQQSFTVTIGTPHLLNDRFLALFRAHYDADPRFDFFSLGNNTVGPDPASTHAFQNADGALVAGWRPWPSLALSLGIGLRHVHIGRGDRDDGRPFTLDAFPALPGVHGGFVNPVTLSAVWTTRADVVRPTRGWRLILLLSHTDKALLSDFEYTRAVGDLSYLYPLWGGRHILGLRAGGGYIDGPRHSIPFWQLEELGGDDTLRGFFPHRFLGKARVLGTAEYRAKLLTFDLFTLWHVQVDGAIFGEVGRVFVSAQDLQEEFRLTQAQADHIVSRPRFSYGGGVRFALSRALVARIDAGFSEEEHGLVYLTFGQAF